MINGLFHYIHHGLFDPLSWWEQFKWEAFCGASFLAFIAVIYCTIGAALVSKEWTRKGK